MCRIRGVLQLIVTVIVDLKSQIVHFTVVCSVALPLSRGEA